VQLFCRVGTQWRTAMVGAVGLDYAVLFRLLDEEGLTGPEWRDTFEDLRVLEAEALQTMMDSKT
jgi:hypothetical protein